MDIHAGLENILTFAVNLAPVEPMPMPHGFPHPPGLFHGRPTGISGIDKASPALRETYFFPAGGDQPQSTACRARRRDAQWRLDRGGWTTMACSVVPRASEICKEGAN